MAETPAVICYICKTRITAATKQKFARACDYGHGWCPHCESWRTVSKDKLIAAGIWQPEG